MLAVTLAVAAVPETLALIVTLTLTHGVKEMVNKNALIRKLQALVLAGLVAIPPVAANLGFVALSGYQWLIALGIALLPIMVAEYGKFWDNVKYREAEKLRVTQQKIH